MLSTKCDVMIELDRPEPACSPGEAVTGTVRLRANEACEARALTLKREWRTHGRGDRARGGRGEVVLDEGPLQLAAGEEREYAFEIVVPGEPYTYRGHYVNIDWYLRAQLDVAWARDPKAETEILVRPPEAGGSTAQAGLRTLPVSELPDAVREQLNAMDDTQGFDAGSDDGRSRSTVWGTLADKLPPPLVWLLIAGVAVVFGLPLLGIVLIGVVLVLTGDSGTQRIIGLAMAGGVLLFAGLLVHRMIRRKLAERRLGSVGAQLRSTDVRLGDPVAWFLRFEPSKEIEVADVRATLRVRERVKRSAGTDRRTYTHTVAEYDASLDARHRIPAGRDTVFAGTIPVPPDAPPSFRVPDNELLWELRVRVDLPGWPDWMRDLPVKVEAPEPRTAPAGG